MTSRATMQRTRSTTQQLLRRKVTLERVTAAGGELVEERENYVFYRFPDGSQIAIPKRRSVRRALDAIARRL